MVSCLEWVASMLSTAKGLLQLCPLQLQTRSQRRESLFSKPGLEVQELVEWVGATIPPKGLKQSNSKHCICPQALFLNQRALKAKGNELVTCSIRILCLITIDCDRHCTRVSTVIPSPLAGRQRREMMPILPCLEMTTRKNVHNYKKKIGYRVPGLKPPAPIHGIW